jgi:hypothetical protein
LHLGYDLINVLTEVLPQSVLLEFVPPDLAEEEACAPLAFERLQYDARKQQVILQSDKRAGPTAATNTFPARDFPAMLLAHVPDAEERSIRKYRADSTRRRARWRRAGFLTDPGRRQ